MLCSCGGNLRAVVAFGVRDGPFSHLWGNNVLEVQVGQSDSSEHGVLILGRFMEQGSLSDGSGWWVFRESWPLSLQNFEYAGGMKSLLVFGTFLLSTFSFAEPLASNLKDFGKVCNLITVIDVNQLDTYELENRINNSMIQTLKSKNLYVDGCQDRDLRIFINVTGVRDKISKVYAYSINYGVLPASLDGMSYVYIWTVRTFLTSGDSKRALNSIETYITKETSDFVFSWNHVH